MSTLPRGAARVPTTAAPAARLRTSRANHREAGGFSWNSAITAVVLAGIAAHFLLRYVFGVSRPVYQFPLQAALLLAGVPLVYGLAVRVWRREFGPDLLAGLSIVTSVRDA